MLDRNAFSRSHLPQSRPAAGSWRHGATLQTFTALVFGKHFGKHAPEQRDDICLSSTKSAYFDFGVLFTRDTMARLRSVCFLWFEVRIILFLRIGVGIHGMLERVDCSSNSSP